tara:strand:- start:294 stop:521 length:228 start_codon:yes stop_codon:yes gene_type:complete
MIKYTTYTYEISFEELMKAVKQIAIMNDGPNSDASNHLSEGSDAPSWIEVLGTKSRDRVMMNKESRIHLSVEIES